jgi:hypothetical protein
MAVAKARCDFEAGLKAQRQAASAAKKARRNGGQATRPAPSTRLKRTTDAGGQPVNHYVSSESEAEAAKSKRRRVEPDKTFEDGDRTTSATPLRNELYPVRITLNRSKVCRSSDRG